MGQDTTHPLALDDRALDALAALGADLPAGTPPAKRRATVLDRLRQHPDAP
jgi:hypothetical protein